GERFISGDDQVTGRSSRTPPAAAALRGCTNQCARVQQCLENALVHQQSGPRFDSILIYLIPAQQRFTLKLARRRVVGEAEKIGQHAPTNFIDESAFVASENPFETYV